MPSATPPVPSPPLPASVRRGYGLGSVATGSFGTVPGLLLLPYLTDRIGVPAAAAGVIVFAPKAWDVVLNPVAGRVSDRSTHPDGRRRPFLIRAGLLLAAAFALLFLGPTAPQWLAAGWVAVAYLGSATAYSFFQVPYVAMPAEITDDYDERTRLMTWRVAILALAILVSGGASPAIRDAFGPDWGYRAVGFFVAALIALGAWGAWRSTRSAPVRSAVATSATFGDQLRIIRADRPFRLLLTTFVLLRSLPDGVVYACVAVVGTGYAGAQMFPLAMLADVASRTSEARTRVGLYTGVWTAGETLGLALGPAAYAAVLALGGYVSSSGSTVPQSDSALTAIALGFSLVPAALVAVSLVSLRPFTIAPPPAPADSMSPSGPGAAGSPRTGKGGWR